MSIQRYYIGLSLVNNRLLLTDPNKFVCLFYIIYSFYLALIPKKYASIEKRTCFKKDLLVTRDQLPNNIPETYLPYLLFVEYRKSPFIPLKNKMFQIMTRFYFRFSYLLF